MSPFSALLKSTFIERFYYKQVKNMGEQICTPETSSAPKILKKIPKKTFKQRLQQDIRKNWVVYVIFAPVLLYFIIFHYIPMFGIIMSFQDFSVRKGVFGSEWVGFENFIRLFTVDDFGRILKNTTMMSLFNLTIGFICPIIFAILLSTVRPRFFKRTIQIASYMPYFIATVVVVAMWTEFLAANGPITNTLTWMFGLPDQNWLQNTEEPVFWVINGVIEIWTGCGYGAIVYCAAIANVNPNQHEAAAIDGAGKWKRLWNVTIPAILPLIVTMLTLRVGLVFTQGFEKVLLLQNPATQSTTSDCLMTYINRVAFAGSADYGLAAAGGLFQSVIASVLLVISNWLNRKVAKSSLF